MRCANFSKVPRMSATTRWPLRSTSSASIDFWLKLGDCQASVIVTIDIAIVLAGLDPPKNMSQFMSIWIISLPRSKHTKCLKLYHLECDQ